jgi:orotate phosphoribosyltransferase
MLAASPTPANALTLALARAGLIQFGRFVQPDGSTWPLALRLRWLPSYPALLHDTAAALEPLLHDLHADRLLTTPDAIPVGVALGLRINIPLVYPYGEERDYTAAYVLEGAYDVAHPTILLADVLIDTEQAQAITALARRVGLDIHTILAVIDLQHGAHEALTAAGYEVRSALLLGTMLPVLVDGGFLPPAMRTAVEAWTEENQRGRNHSH